MTREELNEVLSKIGAVEARSFSQEEGDAWHEILGGRTLQDALSATITFYSKPFTHRAYPGDINALVEDLEVERLRVVGDVRANDADWAGYDIGQVTRCLYQHIRKGLITRESYAAYHESELTLEAFMSTRGVPAGG